MSKKIITDKYKIITVIFHTHEVEGDTLYTIDEVHKEISRLKELTKRSGCDRFIEYYATKHTEKPKKLIDRLLTFFS